MNAIRQIVTPDAAGNISLRVPVELRQRPVEVIVLPADVAADSILSALTGSNAVANALKVLRKAQVDGALQQSIDVLQQEATRNGLTPAMLDELLRGNE